MPPTERLFPDVRWVALGCGAGAIGLGLAYMKAAGAPLWYLAVNVGALVVGIALAGLHRAIFRTGRSGSGWGTALLGFLLLATTLFGVTAEGATRWITIAGFSLQPSLILIPLILVAFARSRSVWSALGVVLACIAVALQPDRGMAGALVAGLLALALLERDRPVLIALTASVGAFAATLLQVDTQGAMPFVDQIFFTAFDVHPLAGLAVLGGAALLLAPSVLGTSGDARSRHARIVFGATWLGVIVAAAVANHPTPLVGYGGSAIIGYVLSAFALPGAAGHPVPEGRELRAGAAQGGRDPAGDARFQGRLGGVATV
jgi:hypothetical protein